MFVYNAYILVFIDLPLYIQVQYNIINDQTYDHNIFWYVFSHNFRQKSNLCLVIFKHYALIGQLLSRR